MPPTSLAHPSHAMHAFSHVEDMEGGEGEEPEEDEEDAGPAGMQVGGLSRGCIQCGIARETMHAAGSLAGIFHA